MIVDIRGSCMSMRSGPPGWFLRPVEYSCPNKTKQLLLKNDADYAHR